MASARLLGHLRPWSIEQITFDVNLRELKGQDRLDVLCLLLRAVGRELHKPVVMMADGTHNLAILGYDVDANRVVMLAKP